MNEEIRNLVGGRLKEEREKLVWSQAVLAEVASVSKRSVAAWEGGETAPGADALALLSLKGLDVLYVLTGQRNLAPYAPTAEQRQVLSGRGIRFEDGPPQAEVEISPLGLLWLLNLRQSMGTGEPMRWGVALLSRLAEFKPVHMRGLNLQAVRLPTYSGNEYPYLIMYLDKTPPAIPWGMTPQAGLKGRYELDLNEHSLPLTFPDDGYLPPVFCLSEADLAVLKNGMPVRYEAGELKG